MFISGERPLPRPKGRSVPITRKANRLRRQGQRQGEKSRRHKMMVVDSGGGAERGQICDIVRI